MFKFEIRSTKFAGVGTRSAEVSRTFKLSSGGGSHAAGMRSLVETESV